ncbi:dsba oxidoreductase [Nitzschia inconspicua]|uniref:Dsba oxidoreductase n=1 Tax=Nitzschia inconspicua TaxID=303405 RepID=A0A9K3KM82_9STRA|nr:dsba oxidoreductase [Nitzschia inconspicua]
MSEEGEPIIEHLSKKYGPSAAQGFNDPNSSLRVMGRKVGIEFNNDRKIVNTKRAHALVEYLKQEQGNDVANQFMEDLYKLYFEDAKDINDESVLVEAVGKYGVESGQAHRVMAPDYLKEISEKDRQNKLKYGVSGVPFFMIYPNDGKSRPVAFSGAYPVEVIAEQLEEAADV